jgi:membrane protein implicated in regulation of membrane protease activity
MCLFGISLFFVMFYTKINLHFSEPSLTREQIIYSFFYAILAMYWLPKARPIILLFSLPPFSFGVLSLTLRQYLGVVVSVLGLYAGLLGVEYVQGCQDFMIQYQIFLFILYSLLLIWFAFFGGFVSNIRQRLRMQKEEIKKVNEEIKTEIEERKLAQIEKDNMIVELKDALLEVKTLSGLLPICAHCKKIRDDKGYWNQIESYVQKHSGAEFSHGICPECSDELYGKEDWYVKMKKNKGKS